MTETFTKATSTTTLLTIRAKHNSTPTLQPHQLTAIATATVLQRGTNLRQTIVWNTAEATATIILHNTVNNNSCSNSSYNSYNNKWWWIEVIVIATGRHSYLLAYIHFTEKHSYFFNFDLIFFTGIAVGRRHYILSNENDVKMWGELWYSKQLEDINIHNPMLQK